MRRRGIGAGTRYHVIKRRGDTRAGIDAVVWHTCSARCCLDVLNRLGVAPNEHIYTGGGEWGGWVWSYLDEPLESDFRIHCEHCGTVLRDPFDPDVSLFGEQRLDRAAEPGGA
ncbi:MAG: hypothetical protein K1X95_14640 [Acidimicrobiia bacterium]|nr:hypothetical protein [Acidimicrobiia bacterium]